MPCLVKRKSVLVVGQSGCGKTTLAKTLVDNLDRAIILDSDFQEFDAQHLMSFRDFYQALEDYGVDDDFRISYTPMDDELKYILTWAKQIGYYRETTLVMEECDRFPVASCLREWESIMKRGRHYGLNMLGITTDCKDVHIGLRRTATEIYCFRITEPADLDWLAKKLPSSVMQEIPQLQDYEYIHWRAGIGSGTMEKQKTKKPA